MSSDVEAPRLQKAKHDFLSYLFGADLRHTGIATPTTPAKSKYANCKFQLSEEMVAALKVFVEGFGEGCAVDSTVLSEEASRKIDPRRTGRIQHTYFIITRAAQEAYRAANPKGPPPYSGPIKFGALPGSKRRKPGAAPIRRLKPVGVALPSSSSATGTGSGGPSPFEADLGENDDEDEIRVPVCASLVGSDAESESSEDSPDTPSNVPRRLRVQGGPGTGIANAGGLLVAPTRLPAKRQRAPPSARTVVDRKPLKVEMKTNGLAIAGTSTAGMGHNKYIQLLGGDEADITESDSDDESLILHDSDFEKEHAPAEQPEGAGAPAAPRQIPIKLTTLDALGQQLSAIFALFPERSRGRKELECKERLGEVLDGMERARAKGIQAIVRGGLDADVRAEAQKGKRKREDGYGYGYEFYAGEDFERLGRQQRRRGGKQHKHKTAAEKKRKTMTGAVRVYGR
ncbi:hypothetical protein HMN09_00991300 [Mycena chlorophos]|uniref:Uncharacterized protein n=1 Tax=Mycena chlorophos TaxID=658473 RepID=A0A8H6SIZ4_MYCCL|nr:hypothetical protein HMN09_00991300 [Mycena chlorophos]